MSRMNGTLTQEVKSPESGLRTPGKPIEVVFNTPVVVGERFTCFGESLTPGMDLRWISTSLVVKILEAAENYTKFETESGSIYTLCG